MNDLLQPPEADWQTDDRLPHGAGFLIGIPLSLGIWALILGGIGHMKGWW